jgi:tight adherence protein C
MDPPPRFYRLTWPLVRLVAHYCGWAVTEATASRIHMALRRAGQDYTLTPAQFFAGKLVASAMFGAGLGWITSKMGQGALAGDVAGVVFGFFMPELWLSDMTKGRNLKILKRLPSFLDIVTMAVEAGMNLSTALLDFPAINSLVSALVQGELMGSSIGPILRAQSEQRRTERFQRAEKLALEAPVKMLGPLIICIFPCTFIVIGFPIVTQLMHSGL